MTVKELNRNEMAELKVQMYDYQLEDRDISYGEMMDIDNLVSDEEVFDYFGDIDFVKDDFACNA